MCLIRNNAGSAYRATPVKTMPAQCWPAVVDGVPALRRHWFSMSCLQVCIPLPSHVTVPDTTPTPHDVPCSQGVLGGRCTARPPPLLVSVHANTHNMLSFIHHLSVSHHCHMGKLSFQMRPTLNDKLSYPSITYLTDLKINSLSQLFYIFKWARSRFDIIKLNSTIIFESHKIEDRFVNIEFNYALWWTCSSRKINRPKLILGYFQNIPK